MYVDELDSYQLLCLKWKLFCGDDAVELTEKQRLENGMAKSNIYSCIMAHGSSYGGNSSPFMYESIHAAGTRGNKADAIKQFKQERGDLSWVEVVENSIYRVS